MIELDDPFENYPELVKEREKAKRILEWEEGIKKHGGYRPGAGAKKKEYKTIYFKLLIKKEKEESVNKILEHLKDTYGAD